MLDRFSRRLSRESTSSSAQSVNQPWGGNNNQSFRVPSWQEGRLVKHGPLASDAYRIWSKAEYLVLTDEHLLKFTSTPAAIAAFPEVYHDIRAVRPGYKPPSAKELSSTPPQDRLEIPLGQVVAVFKEEGTSPRFGVEVWWSDSAPAVSCSNVQLFFVDPEDRTNWMNSIYREIKAKAKKCPNRTSHVSSTDALIPRNVSIRIQQHVASVEPPSSNWVLDIFPVVQRSNLQGNPSSDAELGKKYRDGSSYYLVLGEHLCFLVHVLKATTAWKPEDLVMRFMTFGLTSLVRFRATSDPRDERFVVSFRLPFQRPARLELASRYYKQIVLTFLQADRYLKPSWPQHLQNSIFDIKGIGSPINLPAGEDFGGLRRTIEAFSATFDCASVRWKVNWGAKYPPEFCILPPNDDDDADEKIYSRTQLLALLRALRFNDYFKSISFRDVDFSSMLGLKDVTGFHDNIVDMNRAGMPLDEKHRAIVMESSILFQEMHALCFSSGTLKSIDVTNCLASQTRGIIDGRKVNSTLYQRAYDEKLDMIRPVLMLLRNQQSPCESLILSGNPLTRFDISELVATLKLQHVKLRCLELARCSLNSSDLNDIWASLRTQQQTLEILDLSDNVGHLDCNILQQEMVYFRNMKKLNIAGICLPSFHPLVPLEAIGSWRLEELNFSNLKISDLTMEAICGYMRDPRSSLMTRITMNRCGLSALQVAQLFGAIGQGREMIVSVDGNPLERDGVESLGRMISYNYGPTALFLEMTDFSNEQNYMEILRALTVNRTIKLLSLAGTSTHRRMGLEASIVLAEFFAKNETLKYLDISGYAARLDETPLGKGFTNSLTGLRENKALRHLRIRGQDLNEDVGGLGAALAGNNALLTLDIEDNGFSLSNLTYLVRNLDKHQKIVQFAPFSERAFDAAIEASVDKLLPLPLAGPAKTKSEMSKGITKTANQHKDSELPASMRELVSQLREEWSVQMANLEATLERNRKQRMDRELAVTERMDELSVCEYTSLFGGLATKEDMERKTRLSLVEQQCWQVGPGICAPQDSSTSMESRCSSQQPKLPPLITVPPPRHVTTEEITESGDQTGELTISTSGFSTTPDLVSSPTEGDNPTVVGSGRLGEDDKTGVLVVHAERAASPEVPRTPVDGVNEWGEEGTAMANEQPGSIWGVNKAIRHDAPAPIEEENEADGNEADRDST